MTTTTRIRVYLILAAVLPPLLILLSLHLITNERIAESARRNADESIQSFRRYDQVYHERMRTFHNQLVQMPQIREASMRLKSRPGRPVDLGALPPGIDFMEILSHDLKVLASAHRPGLVGGRIALDTINMRHSGYSARVEYDINGPHAAYGYLNNIDENLLLYSGTYIDSTYLNLLSEVTNAAIALVMADDSSSQRFDLSRLDVRQLYEKDSELITVISGGKAAGFFITAVFDAVPASPIFRSLFEITALAALISIILAIIMGMYITGKTKKEIDNLIAASRQVAEGDWTTPVMAYEEGEFSELADSFNAMKSNLKTTQARLTTAEKIAAWEAMGRKVAHEIKNPLTPISIGIDDLKAAYRDNPDTFESTLEQTVKTIRHEINRMKRLLDQFSAFAKMAPPKIVDTPVKAILDEIAALYKTHIDDGRLTIITETSPKYIKCDPEQIEQMLINLIKNGLESGPNSRVEVLCDSNLNTITFTIRDTGPGFEAGVLNSPFEPYVSTKKEGSGLGLVICHRIVHDHGGTIELRNRPDGGAEVLIVLPQ